MNELKPWLSVEFKCEVCGKPVPIFGWGGVPIFMNKDHQKFCSTKCFSFLCPVEAEEEMKMLVRICNELKPSEKMVENVTNELPKCTDNPEPRKMRECEIVQAWKANKFMAFGGMSEECQEWAREHGEERIWRTPGAELPHRICCNPRTIYTLNPGYQPPAPKSISGWVEFDIAQEAFRVEFNHGAMNRHWQNWALPTERFDRTLPDGRVLTKFGGYLYTDSAIGYTDHQKTSTDEIPIKICFWAERMRE